MSEDTIHEPNSQPFSSVLQSHFEHFETEPTHAPELSTWSHQSIIGIDNRQRCKYDLTQIRKLLSSDSTTKDLPLLQVVGDSGTPFDEDKIAEAQSVLSSYGAGCMIEYGLTASRHDTNWLVAEHRASHPETVLIASVVQDSVGALRNGFDACTDATKYLLLFDRLYPTKFGDDVWLSDGIMDPNYGDKMICFEGGPQALYQCSNALVKGIPIIAVSNLRSKRFSASRLLIAFKNGSQCAEEYLNEIQLTTKQSNVARWCVSLLQQSGDEVASLIVPVEIMKNSASSD